MYFLKKKALKYYNLFVDYKNKLKINKARKVFPKLPKPQIVNTKETIEYIINHKVSVSRFGDGEFTMVLGKSIGFQSYNRLLMQKLRKILIADTPNHITCLPITLVSTTSFN